MHSAAPCTLHRTFDRGQQTVRELAGWLVEVATSLGGLSAMEAEELAGAAVAVVEEALAELVDALAVVVDIVLGQDEVEVRFAPAMSGRPAVHPELLVYRPSR